MTSDAERSSFVLCTMRGVGQGDRDALRHYVEDRVAKQSSKGYCVHWYEVEIKGRPGRDSHDLFSVRVTAHSSGHEEFASVKDTDKFLAVRDVFATLEHLLRCSRDLREGRHHPKLSSLRRHG
jgi:ribosome-associated translation inhibitor RaiA